MKHGYVLTKSYTGQQGSSLTGLVTLQCWMELYMAPVYVVQPFLENSFTHGFPSNNKLRFSSFFDVDVYNKVSVEDGYTEVASLENFLQNAPHNTVVVVSNQYQSGITKLSWNSHECNHQLELAIYHVIKVWFLCGKGCGCLFKQ